MKQIQMNPLELYLKMKTCLDYSAIIKDTDDDLAKELTFLQRYQLKDLVKDAIDRSRELRFGLAKLGVFRLGNRFMDGNCRIIIVKLNSDKAVIQYQ